MKPLLQAVDPITTTKLRHDLVRALQQKPLRLAEIIDRFSDRLPAKWSWERKDRYFNALLQKMRREYVIKPVHGRWKTRVTDGW